MTHAEIRQASSGDVESLLELVRECIEGMRRKGIDQWDDIYPDRATLERDIDEATAFVAVLQGVPVGMAVLNDRQEPEYADVPWLYGEHPAVVHRMMVSPAAEGTGISRALMARLEGRAKISGYDCIRLDAFRKNPRAIRFYERSGYRIAGGVKFRKGQFLCFEKWLASVGKAEEGVVELERLAIEIDVGSVKDRDELHVLLAKKLGFPDYYGKNWDAFDECIRDYPPVGPLRVTGIQLLRVTLPREAELLKNCLDELQAELPGRQVVSD